MGNARILESGGTLVLERPWFDTVPLFISVGERCVALAENWEALQPFAAVDLSYVQDYLRYQVPQTHRTFCTGVSLIRNGERWTFDGAAPPRISKQAVPEPLREDIQELLEQAVVAAGPQAVLHLSSGLDSSLLAMLAHRLFGQARAATFRTRGAGAEQELATTERLAQEKGIELDIYDFREIDLWAEGRNLLRDGLSYPIAHPSHLVRYLLDRSIKSAGASTIVTGRGPDELLGGYASHLPEHEDVAAYARRTTCTPEEWIGRLFISPQASDAAVERDTCVVRGRLPLRNRLELDLSGIFEAWNIVDAGLARGLGLRYVNPFLTPDAAALMFFHRDAEKVPNRRQKEFLRHRFARFYPDYLLGSPKIGLTIDIREYLQRESVSSIVRRLYDDSTLGQRILRRTAVAQMVDDTLSHRRNFGWQIWSLYLCGVAFDNLFANRLGS